MSRWKSHQIDFDTNGQRKLTATLWPRMSFLLSVWNELFICKLHASLPSYSPPSGGALCTADCTHQRPPDEGRIPFRRNLSIKSYRTAKNLERLGRGDPGLLPGTRMSFIWSILTELLTCKRHLSLPGTRCRVVCISLCRGVGIAREVKHPLLDNLSIKILPDLINSDTNAQSRPRATLWPKMSILLSILKELFTCKLHLSLPAIQQRVLYAYHCVQAAASHVKVSTLCLIISVSKDCLILLILILIVRADPQLLCDQSWASCF